MMLQNVLSEIRSKERKDAWGYLRHFRDHVQLEFCSRASNELRELSSQISTILWTFK